MSRQSAAQSGVAARTVALVSIIAAAIIVIIVFFISIILSYLYLFDDLQYRPQVCQKCVGKKFFQKIFQHVESHAPLLYFYSFSCYDTLMRTRGLLYDEMRPESGKSPAAARLYLEIRDSSLIDEKKIKSSGAPGVIRPNAGNVHVVIGQNVQFVADEFKKLCE